MSYSNDITSTIVESIICKACKTKFSLEYSVDRVLSVEVLTEIKNSFGKK
jgi:hypothetical protein